MQHRKYIDKEELETYLKYNTKKDAAKYFNTSRYTIDILIKEYNIVLLPSYVNKINGINIEQFKKDATNLYMYELAKKYNITEADCRKLMREYNIPKKKKTFKSPLKYNYDSIDKNKFIDYYRNHSVEEICSHFNISNAIYVNLKHMYELNYKRYSPKVQNILDNIEEFALYRKTHSDEEIYQHYGITNNTVRRIVNICNLDKTQYNKAESLESVLKRVNKAEFVNYYTNHDITDICEHFNLSYRRYNDLLHCYDIEFIRSHLECNIYDYLVNILGEDKILRNKRLLNGLEIDLYLPDYNIGIEFNGDYWHSDIFKEKNYHLDKSKLAQEKGIHLIHIWEHEWNNPETQEKVKLFLDIVLGRVNKKIYARNCEIKEISNKEAESFNEAYHLQGHRNAKVTYGLFYEGQLVQLMSFSKTKYNRNLKGDNDWEIIRGCPGSNNIVVGGVSKLFSHFVKDYNPDSVFSYCDFNKFDGKSYEALGMKFIGYTGPDKKWLLDNKVVNRQPAKYKELKEKALGIIWGAGSKKYLWTKKENIYVN